MLIVSIVLIIISMYIMAFCRFKVSYLSILKKNINNIGLKYYFHYFTSHNTIVYIYKSSANYFIHNDYCSVIVY